MRRHRGVTILWAKPWETMVGGSYESYRDARRQLGSIKVALGGGGKEWCPRNADVLGVSL